MHVLKNNPIEYMFYINTTHIIVAKEVKSCKTLLNLYLFILEARNIKKYNCIIVDSLAAITPLVTSQEVFRT